jgi:hypothetical protein
MSWSDARAAELQPFPSPEISSASRAASLPPAAAVARALHEPHDPHPEPERYETLYRKTELSLGAAVLANFDTTVQVSSATAGLGAVLDLEDSLGVTSSTTIGRLDTFYAFSDAKRINLSYYDIRRSGMRQINDDIMVGDVVIPAGGVATVFNTTIFKLAYQYNFVTDSRTTIGASIGLYTMGLDLGFAASTFAASESVKATAPLPVLGLHGAYALTEKWRLSASFEVLEVEIGGEFKGAITDSLLGLSHDTFEHFGWGIGYNGFRLDLEVIQGDRVTDIEYAYQGLLLYLRVY